MKTYKYADYQGLTPYEAIVSFLCQQYEWCGKTTDVITLSVKDYRGLFLELKDRGTLLLSVDEDGTRSIELVGPFGDVRICVES